MMLQSGDDYNAETLLQKLGLADLVEYSDAKIRCIIPISDALEEANTGDNGTHWSLMILEITKTNLIFQVQYTQFFKICELFNLEIDKKSAFSNICCYF